MKKVHVNASKEYDVLIGKNLLTDCGKLISEVMPKGKTAIISDDKVYGLYGEMVKKSLEESGYSVDVYTFPNGEKSKNIATYTGILEFLANVGLTRSDFLVALGGGVTGDMAGFAAASYLRGIEFVQIPTTFLAAIDSSVGGKTGVNLNAGKNLAGAFHQPSLVICDTETFKTLSEENFADGVAEAIKYGMISMPELLEKLSGDYINEIDDIIEACVSIKRDIVNEDEFEGGVRKLLNFGHTIGHGVEKCSGYGVTHGHGVAIGMSIITKATEDMGLCDKGLSKKLDTLISKCGLPTKCPYTAEELYKVALSDKKRSGGSITVVLPKHEGECVLKKITVDELLEYIKKGI